MKFKSPTSTVFLFVAIVCLPPQIALAAWWNPFTWFSIFNKKPTPIEQPISIPVMSTTTSTIPKTNTTHNLEEVRKEKNESEAIEKAQIDALIADEQRQLDEQNRQTELLKKAENEKKIVQPPQEVVPQPVVLQNNQTSSNQTPQYLIQEKSITIITPSGGEIFLMAQNLYNEEFPSGGYKRIKYVREGDPISYSWKWTGPMTLVMPVVYLHNIDTNKDLPEFFPISNFNNYGISEGATTRFRMCLPNGYGCPAEFAPGRYNLRICEFPEDKNPKNNALYPVGQTPLCKTSGEFTIKFPETVPEEQTN